MRCVLTLCAASRRPTTAGSARRTTASSCEPSIARRKRRRQGCFDSTHISSMSALSVPSTDSRLQWQSLLLSTCVWERTVHVRDLSQCNTRLTSPSRSTTNAIPYNPDQCTRKCGIFGVCCKGIPQQINYLIDEGMAMSKGRDGVISYLQASLLPQFRPRGEGCKPALRQLVRAKQEQVCIQPCSQEHSLYCVTLMFQLQATMLVYCRRKSSVADHPLQPCVYPQSNHLQD